MKPIITLTTDFGTLDHRVAAIKGSIFSMQNDAQIVDISHQISPHHLMQTAYVLGNAYHHFPKGTIHIIGVDSFYHKERKFLICKAEGHFFILADNGLFSLIFQNIKAEKIYEITLNNRFDDRVNFTPIDIFVPVAVHLSKGGIPEMVAREITEIKEVIAPKSTFNEAQKMLIGEIIYIDHFGNAVSNISREIFEKIMPRYTSFSIKFRNLTINKIVEIYTDVVKNWENENAYAGKEMALFNDAQYLEIALYKGCKSNGACSLLGLNVGEKIFIEFS